MWEQTSERREEGAIRRPERRAAGLPAEHRELMPQHDQLNVFGDLAAPAPNEQPQNSGEREISEGKEHHTMLPKAALQLRYLQTLLELGSSQTTTIVFPAPTDLVTPFLNQER